MMLLMMRETAVSLSFVWICLLSKVVLSYHSGPYLVSHSRRVSLTPVPLLAVSATSSYTNAEDEVVDVAIIGAGLGGLCAGAILNTIYGMKVGIYEAHYLAGGCAHAFPRSADNGETFVFDSGPTILLGCSSPPYNALRQVMDAVGEKVEWIPYQAWGMIENPAAQQGEVRWRVELGPDAFEEGPLRRFGGDLAVKEFRELRELTKDLVVGAKIPAMAMRAGSTAIVPLLRYFETFVSLIQQGEKLTGTFAPYMDGPLYKVTSPWLRNWIDAFAFSLSGLPASRTAAAAVAFTLSDMHREGAALDYPKGGMGSIVDALVRGVEQGNNGSSVYLKQKVASIDCNEDASKITGITLAKNGKRITARKGVICNAPVWSLRDLVSDERVLSKLNNLLPLKRKKTVPTTWTSSKLGASISLERQVDNIESQTLLERCDGAEMTGSFMHLHLAIDTTGLAMDGLEAHYTVMDRSLDGSPDLSVNGVLDGPCAEANMIAVSNPCMLDPSLAPPNRILIHAYGAANEPYELWASMKRNSPEYTKLKEERAKPLWKAVECIIPDVRKRIVLSLIGSPLTHARFLRRPNGTYGSATEDYLKDGSTPYRELMLASDGVFPGIGVPAVAIAGASAANSLVGVLNHWLALDELQRKNQAAGTKGY